MNARFEYLLRLGDDALILGQQLGLWTGHGPVLEEDIALTNIGLDQIGQATGVAHLGRTGRECQGRDEDAPGLSPRPIRGIPERASCVKGPMATLATPSSVNSFSTPTPSRLHAALASIQ